MLVRQMPECKYNDLLGEKQMVEGEFFKSEEEFLNHVHHAFATAAEGSTTSFGR